MFWWCAYGARRRLSTNSARCQTWLSRERILDVFSFVADRFPNILKLETNMRVGNCEEDRAFAARQRDLARGALSDECPSLPPFCVLATPYLT
jgi:hypothetical protein